MRRAPIVLSATALGFAAVLAFKPREPLVPARPVTMPPAPAARSRPAATVTVAAKSRSRSATADGEVVPTPYGNAQVRVTVRDGRITQVKALQLQGNDPKSLEIASYAEPLLRKSVLTAQSADIDVVSGATFTSTSYTASLQSALDKLGFKAPDESRANTEGAEGYH
jgi:uncharacterized protein with FMN-binding domain